MTYLGSRHFIALVVTTALVITGFSAAPARADQDDVGKALAALAGLAVLGAVIHSARDGDSKKRPHVVDRRYRSDDRFQESARSEQAPKPRRAGRKVLPQQCLRSADAARSEVRLQLFGQGCLRRHYNHVDSLPRKCVRYFRTDRGTGEGYGARCLKREGYVLARR